MRISIAASAGAVLLAACGGAPNPYPEAARAEFARQCPLEDAACACTWDRLTRALTHEEYEAAMARFREEGLMDPRVTRARGYCREKHAG